jgi:hypothetical protein
MPNFIKSIESKRPFMIEKLKEHNNSEVRMNTKYTLFTIIIVGLLHSTNTTAMMTQLVRHKILLAPLLPLSTQQNSDSLCPTPTLSRTYSSSPTYFATQRTIGLMQGLLETNSSRINRTKGRILETAAWEVMGASIMTVGGAGYYGLPALGNILKDTHPLLDLTGELSNIVGLYGGPFIFTTGAVITSISTCSLAFRLLLLAYLKGEAKYLEKFTQRQDSRVDMPKDKD